MTDKVHIYDKLHTDFNKHLSKTGEQIPEYHFIPT